jgi:4-oxalocrotonate tautomerase
MPLVRISHAAGKSTASVLALSKGVHQAMVDTFDVPEDDYFQIVTEHLAGTGLIGPQSFLGIAHSRDLVMVQITCSEGRSVEKKKALYASINKHLTQDANLRAEDIIVNLVETKRENWSFGLGLAQYAL